MFSCALHPKISYKAVGLLHDENPLMKYAFGYGLFLKKHWVNN